MNNTATLLTDYTRLQTLLNQQSKPDPRLRLPFMKRGIPVFQTVEKFSTAADLWSALEACQPCAGWLQWQSHQLPFEGTLPQPEQNWGMLLGGEVVTSDEHTLALHHSPANLWTLTRIAHDPNSDGLWDEVLHLASNQSFGALRYRRYWKNDLDRGAIQTMTCFTGFVKQKGD